MYHQEMSSSYDWIIIGSGFGGSVSALRLAEKGYRVLVIEKGRRFRKDDFPKSNWDMKKWMWMPKMGLKGIFQMSFLEHVTVLHGVGVGGGSLVYANTLPMPKSSFFEAPSWAHLRPSWEEELAPHYKTAQRMLGANRCPVRTRGDRVLGEIAKDIGRGDHHEPTDVAVFFGKPGTEVPDPYFDGEGPRRSGCTFCGACMTGCRVGAKNTLDKNYLYLAEKLGARIAAEREVVDVLPATGGGYHVETVNSLGSGEDRTFFAPKVVFSGGVMGTIPLLLKLKEGSLPKLSPRLGDFIRTNNEALLGIITSDPKEDFTEGIAITSILHTDEHSHIEPVRYGRGSGFFRLLIAPHAPGPTMYSRLASVGRGFVKNPLKWLRALTVKDFAKQSQVLLYMQTLESTLTFRLGRSLRTGWKMGLISSLDDPDNAPSAFIEEATDLANRFAEKVKGVTANLMTETVLGVPSTAHILGGCAMGSNEEEGVINHRHEVFGYDGLYVIDGSSMSANPGVNTSLTITAMAERAHSFIENAEE